MLDCGSLSIKSHRILSYSTYLTLMPTNVEIRETALNNFHHSVSQGQTFTFIGLALKMHKLLIDFLSRKQICFFSTLMKGKSLSKIMGLLLDGRLQGLLANPKVSESMKSKSPLLLPWIAIWKCQTFWKHKTSNSWPIHNCSAVMWCQADATILTENSLTF